MPFSHIRNDKNYVVSAGILKRWHTELEGIEDLSSMVPGLMLSTEDKVRFFGYIELKYS